MNVYKASGNVRYPLIGKPSWVVNNTAAHSDTVSRRNPPSRTRSQEAVEMLARYVYKVKVFPFQLHHLSL